MAPPDFIFTIISPQPFHTMKDQTNITIIIHTYNEAHNIAECIESARILTNTIIVVDMESTDGTQEMVKKTAVPLVTFPFSYYVEPARAFGIQQAQTDWVFIMDADERMTPEVAKEIQSVINNELYTKELTKQEIQSIQTYFKVPRKNIFGRTKWLEHGGWWPDAQMRLINKRFFKSWPQAIHSTPIIEGQMGLLTKPFLHYFHGDIEKMVEKTIIYENIEANLLHQAQKPVSTPTFFRKFFGELFRRLIKKQGFKDGHIGIIESIYQAFSKTITYIYLYEKKKSSTV